MKLQKNNILCNFITTPLLISAMAKLKPDAETSNNYLRFICKKVEAYQNFKTFKSR